MSDVHLCHLSGTYIWQYLWTLRNISLSSSSIKTAYPKSACFNNITTIFKNPSYRYLSIAFDTLCWLLFPIPVSRERKLHSLCCWLLFSRSRWFTCLMHRIRTVISFSWHSIRYTRVFCLSQFWSFISGYDIAVVIITLGDQIWWESTNRRR